MGKRGRRPYGYYADERAVIERIRLKRRLRKGARGPTPYARIARELNAEGATTQTGRPWCGWLVCRVLAKVNSPAPARRRAASKGELASTDWLRSSEIAACVAAADWYESILFETLLRSGLRASELCSLSIRDLAVTAGRRHIEVRRGKGGRARSVLIDPTAAAMLAEHIAKRRSRAGKHDPAFLNRWGRRMKYQNLYDAIASLARKTRILHLHPHTLRHTFAMISYNYKRDLIYVQKQLGHRHLDTTQIYANTLEKLKLSDSAEIGRLFDAAVKPKETIRFLWGEI